MSMIVSRSQQICDHSERDVDHAEAIGVWTREVTMKFNKAQTILVGTMQTFQCLTVNVLLMQDSGTSKNLKFTQ